MASEPVHHFAVAWHRLTAVRHNFVPAATASNHIDAASGDRVDQVAVPSAEQPVGGRASVEHIAAARAAELVDPAVAAVRLQPVTTRPPADDVGSGAAKQLVLPRPPAYRVCPWSSNQAIPPAATVDQVVAAPASEAVAVRTSQEGVVAPRSGSGHPAVL